MEMSIVKICSTLLVGKEYLVWLIFWIIRSVTCTSTYLRRCIFLQPQWQSCVRFWVPSLACFWNSSQQLPWHLSCHLDSALVNDPKDNKKLKWIFGFNKIRLIFNHLPILFLALCIEVNNRKYLHRFPQFCTALELQLKFQFWFLVQMSFDK